jgi:hypothetical protein
MFILNYFYTFIKLILQADQRYCITFGRNTVTANLNDVQCLNYG